MIKEYSVHCCILKKARDFACLGLNMTEYFFCRTLFGLRRDLARSGIDDGSGKGRESNSGGEAKTKGNDSFVGYFCEIIILGLKLCFFPCFREEEKKLIQGKKIFF